MKSLKETQVYSGVKSFLRSQQFLLDPECRCGENRGVKIGFDDHQVNDTDWRAIV